MALTVATGSIGCGDQTPARGSVQQTEAGLLPGVEADAGAATIGPSRLPTSDGGQVNDTSDAAEASEPPTSVTNAGAESAAGTSERPPPHPSADSSMTLVSESTVPAHDTTSDVPDSIAPPEDRWLQGAPLFSSAAIADIDIDLPPASIDGLNLDASTYVHGALRVTLHDGTQVNLADVGVRLKGRLGSARQLTEKCSFLLKANEFVKGQRLFGLNKLAINNLVQDPSMLHEQLSYELFRAMDVPAPRSGFARVRVNGHLKGLYATIEVVDNASFLEHWFAHADGNLYEGSYGTDLESGLLPTFDQDRGDDIAFGDLADLTTALDQMRNPETFISDVEDWIDLDAYVRFAATELFMSHWDGYAATRNNYFIYRPVGDQWHWIPWGTDQTFGNVSATIWNGRGRLQTMCEASLVCRQNLASAYGQLIGLVAQLNFLNRVDELEQTIRDAVAEDTAKEYETEAVHTAIAQLRVYLRDRPSFVAGELRCTDPSNFDDDRDGASGCGQDCNDRDATVHPGAYEACNLVDDDCSGLIDDANECPQCATVTDDGGVDYAFCFARATYAVAQAECLNLGGALASVRDQQEQTWLNAAISSLNVGNEWWIGLNDSYEEGIFQWDDGSEVAYTNWNAGEPNDFGGNEDCAQLTWGVWNDLPCSRSLGYICRL